VAFEGRQGAPDLGDAVPISNLLVGRLVAKGRLDAAGEGPELVVVDGTDRHVHGLESYRRGHGPTSIFRHAQPPAG
jgi:hypothetical protein